MSGGSVGALVLAAGASTRLGRPKQLLPWAGCSLIRRVVTAARAAGCAPVAVVLGAAGEEIEAALDSTSATVVFNPDWERGLGTSIRCGVQHLGRASPPIDSLVLLVCDQPLVDAAVIAALIAPWKEKRSTLVACRYAETVGVPALFDRVWFDALLRLPDDAGAKVLLQAQAETVVAIPFEEGAIDLDTPADLRRAGLE